MKKLSFLPFTALIILAITLSACGGGESVQPAAEAEQQAPTPEEAAAAEESDDSALYAEDFEDGTSCFEPAQLQNASLGLENGELIIDVTSSGELIWSTCEEVQLSDFSIELDIYDDTTAAGFHYFGLLFRSEPAADGSLNWYEVHFGLGEGFSPAFCSGLATETTFESFTESIYDDSCWVDLPERIEAGQWNHFEISANGPVLTYSVNGTFIAALNDPRIEQGNFGLLAGTFDGEASRIKFDNIRITTLTE
jgi:hypothetical protein